MVGDLGNVLCDETGKCTVSIRDSTVKLLGPHSVTGRSIVVYLSEDDGGQEGGHDYSLTTRNAGPRMAAGVIGLSAQ
jgi:Cu-Zn family superoxide dismutase